MSFVAIAIIGTILCNLKNAGAQEFVSRSGNGWDDFAVAAAETVICEEEAEQLGRPCNNPAIFASVYESGNTVKLTVRIPTSYAEHARAIERLVRATFRAYAPRGKRLELKVWVLSRSGA